ncbi:MAG: pyridoxamine 5'-phosphate oxidase [Acidimicrobiia bacterium]
MVVADPTIAWGEFADQEPELAQFGIERLTAAPAYMATVRRSGAPRVHPVTPIFTPTGLFLFMEPGSPKGRDVRERGRFALHNGVLDNEGTGGEFSIEGRGLAVGDPDMWSMVAEAASYSPADSDVLFELRLSAARCKGYGDVSLPKTQRWSR